MRLRYFFYLSLLCFPVQIHAQSGGPVSVSHERSAKGDVIFYAETDSYVPYTVSLTFSNLSNANFPGGATYDAVTRRGRTRLLTLRPSEENVPIGFAYQATFRKGDTRLNPDTNFVYLFPLAQGKVVRANLMGSVEKVLGKIPEDRITGLSFKTTAGDTVFAIRGGLVTEVEEHSASATEKTSFNATENYLEIFHKDGTFARYKLFRNDGIFVLPGDKVIPGQPLGIIGGENYRQGSHLRLSIYRPDQKSYSYVPDFYLSPEATGKPEPGVMYTSSHPVEIIVKEMSRKEKKKFLSKE